MDVHKWQSHMYLLLVSPKETLMRRQLALSPASWTWSLTVDWVICVWAQKHCWKEGIKMPLMTLHKVSCHSNKQCKKHTLTLYPLVCALDGHFYSLSVSSTFIRIEENELNYRMVQSG